MKTTTTTLGFLDHSKSLQSIFCRGKSWIALSAMMLIGFLMPTQASAQIAQRGTATVATTTNATLTIGKPTGLTVNDLMIAHIGQSNNNSSNMGNASRSGWTVLTGTAYVSSGTNRYHYTILYKIADATDVAASNFAFTANAASDDSQGAILAFSGVNTTTPFDATFTTGSGTGSSISVPGLTTTTPNAAIIMFGALTDDTNFGTGSWNTTSPGALTELYDEEFTAADVDMSIGAAGAIKATAGATGNGTDNLGSVETYGTVMVALKPITTATGTITGSPFCAGNSISVPYTLNAVAGQYNATNTFTAQLSNASGSFASPVTLGTVANTNTAGTISGTIPAGTTTGTGYRVRVISSSPAGLGSDNGVNIAINAQATAAAGSAFNACITNTAIPITTGATATNNAGVLWTSNGTGTINNPTSLSTATYTPGVGEAATVTFTLTATGNTPCGNATSNKVMTFFQQPTATAGGSATICSNQTHQVSGASSSNGTIQWTENGAGSITAGATTLTPTYTPAAGDAGNTVTLTMTVSNSPCTAATATYTINVVGAATANAGTAITTCEDAGAVNITAGSTSTNNAGVLWTSSGTGTFTNDTSMTLATYAPSAADILAGSVTLTLTATGNTPCGNATSNKTFTIRHLPTASAGGSATICQNQTATVSGASSSNGTIQWTENGAGSITAGATTLTPTYTAAAGDAGNTVTLTMTVSNNPCTPATATYTVVVIAAPTSAAGSAFSTCANSGAINITAGASASNASSVAWTSSGTGTFINADSLTLAEYTPSAADITAGSVILTLTSNGNGPCANVTSNKTLTILPVPVAAPVAVCQGQPGVAMNATGCSDSASVSVGPDYAGAGANSGTGTVWSNPGNVVSDNNSNATFSGSTSSATTSQALHATNFGFALPADAIIEGVVASVGRYRSGGLIGGEARDSSIRLLKAGVATGDNKGATGTNWPTSEAVANYGSASDLWNVSLTAADVNASNFGVAFVGTITQSTFGSRTANIDYIRVTVTYRLPGILEWFTASSGGTAIGSGASFNPVGVAGSGLTDTNTPGTTTYYVGCSTVAGSSCRTAVDYVINALPTVNFTGLAASYCEDAAAVTLTGNHTGAGTFSGAGITDNGNGTASFNPATAGVGPHAITYSYTDGNTCVNSDVQNVTILQNITYYADTDNDGFGNPAAPQVSCAGAPAGHVLDNTDCDDTNNAIHTTFPFYVDADGDTYGTGALVPVCAVDALTPPAGYSVDGTDCDDTNNAIHQTFDFYADGDGDTYGAGALVPVCAVDALTPPAGYSLDGSDCDDTNNAIHETFEFYVDADGDSYGTGNLLAVCAVDALTPPAGYSLDNTDCDDANAAIYQSATLYIDADSDSYTSGVTAVVCYGAAIPAGYVASLTAIDCDDTIAAIHPNAIEIPYNGVDDDCDNSIDETGTVTTTLLGSSCGVTLASIQSLVGIQTVGGHPITGYRIRIAHGAEVQVIEKVVPHFTIPQFPSYAYATTYTVDIQLQRAGIWQASWGAACLVSTPAILEEGGAASVSPSQCGIVLPKINTLIATTSIQGVTGYRFRITNLTDPLGPQAVQQIDRAQNWFSLPMLGRHNFGTTYRIEVSVKTTGAYGGFGAACEVSSPAAPSLINCGGTVATGTTTVAATSVQGATQYRFQITRVSDNASATIDRNVNWFIFNSIPPAIFSPGVAYNVRVAVMTTGTWSPFGDACEITSPGVAAKGIVSGAQTAGDDMFRATAFPNPFTSEFGFEITTSGKANVEVKVYDMIGQLIESRIVNVSELAMQKLGAQYPAGVYNVIVSQDGITKTLRVIKR